MPERIYNHDRGVAGRRVLDLVLLIRVFLEMSIEPPSQLVSDASEAFRSDRQAYEAVLGEALGDNLRATLDCDDASEGSAKPRSVADLVRILRRTLAGRKAPPAAPSGYAELDRLTGGLSGYVLVSGNPVTDPAALALNLVYRVVEADPAAAALLMPSRGPRGNCCKTR